MASRGLLSFDPATGKLMTESMPSYDEYMEHPDKYPNLDLIMDSAGKFKVVTKAEAKRRNDQHVVTAIYDRKSGGFF